jgi:hypothetical protein
MDIVNHCYSLVELNNDNQVKIDQDFYDVMNI